MKHATFLVCKALIRIVSFFLLTSFIISSATMLILPFDGTGIPGLAIDLLCILVFYPIYMALFHISCCCSRTPRPMVVAVGGLLASVGVYAAAQRQALFDHVSPAQSFLFWIPLLLTAIFLAVLSRKNPADRRLILSRFCFFIAAAVYLMLFAFGSFTKYPQLTVCVNTGVILFCCAAQMFRNKTSVSTFFGFKLRANIQLIPSAENPCDGSNR